MPVSRQRVLAEDLAARGFAITVGLVRALAQGGEPAVARIQLDRVVALRWRVPFPGLIDVELVRFRGERAPLARVLSAEWRRRGETLEATTFSVAARRSWW